MDKKKLKLSISANTKKTINNIEQAKSNPKNSVIINNNKTFKKKKFYKSTSSGNKFNKPLQNIGFKKPAQSYFPNKDLSDFEKRKLAEQRATKRIKGELTKENKEKNSIKKRELKLTISRALSDEDGAEIKGRSLASIRRARLKENREQTIDDKQEYKPVKRDVSIPEVITIRELANRMSEQSSNLIKHLLTMGVKATINHAIDSDTAEYLVKEFGHNSIKEEKAEDIIKKIKESKNENLKSRPPIVTIMGHVDHGKTSLLDVLRKTNVVKGEHGGITQHIGAYQIIKEDNKITFIDTPGHAAFTEMRARGSKLTDIVVLVVAADDGVKPQTVESIKHAKAANVPIVVAINKCDLPEADPTKIKNQLLEHELIAEDLSGDTLMIEISTKTKNNLDKLIESINLQAELLDLKTEYENEAKGIVLESKIDLGRGPVVNIVVTSGNLKKGDYFVSGKKWGKIRAIINDQGQNIEIAEPSTPVEILGINGASNAGDDFIVLPSEKEAKNLVEVRVNEAKEGIKNLSFVTKDTDFFQKTSQDLNIIIKSDVHGSAEAIKFAISNIKHDEVKAKILLSDIGMVTETDITLAKASEATVIAFNVKPSKEAKKLAEKENIKIDSFNIIYELIDFIKNKMSGLLTPEINEEITGTAEILDIFKVSKVGKVAGSKVLNGEINQDSHARIIRDGAIIFSGRVGSIFREKNQVKQVNTGLECGISLKDFNDFQIKDIIEAYRSKTIERQILS
jgi:translation initiation factor IF-2